MLLTSWMRASRTSSGTGSGQNSSGMKFSRTRRISSAPNVGHTSFLVVRFKSKSLGSIIRSLNAYKRRNDLKGVSFVSLLGSSSSDSMLYIPNRSVSHRDQFPIWHLQEDDQK